MTKQAKESDASGEPVVLEWSVHPASRRPVVTAMLLLMIPVTGIAAYQYVGSVGFALVACALLVASLLPFLLRTHYALADGLLRVRTVLYRFERDLTAFRAFEMDESRAWLCTLSQASRLDNYRGLLLYLDANADDVRAALTAAGLSERKRGRSAR